MYNDRPTTNKLFLESHFPLDSGEENHPTGALKIMIFLFMSFSLNCRIKMFWFIDNFGSGV